MTIDKTSIKQYADEVNLKTLYAPSPLDQIYLETAEINRPGLMLTGYTDMFEPKRVQIIGLMEHSYLEKLDHEKRYQGLKNLCENHPVCIVITRSLEPFQELLDLVKEYDIPLLSSPEKTSDIMSATISFLNVALAPTISQHGEFIEVYGEGILILGESGVGKSETAIELLKRGHRLISDDSVILKKVSDHSIIGSSPDNIRYFMELRGIGIINVKQLFGMGAVKTTERVDLVIKLEHWVPGKNYSTLGQPQEKINILGNELPLLTIPVRPGRNLAVIIEVAAMNYKDQKMGFNAEEELLNQLGMPL